MANKEDNETLECQTFWIVRESEWRSGCGADAEKSFLAGFSSTLDWNNFIAQICYRIIFLNAASGQVQPWLPRKSQLLATELFEGTAIDICDSNWTETTTSATTWRCIEQLQLQRLQQLFDVEYSIRDASVRHHPELEVDCTMKTRIDECTLSTRCYSPFCTCWLCQRMQFSVLDRLATTQLRRSDSFAFSWTVCE